MTFRHAMTYQTQGINIVAPLSWRTFDGIVADYWQAEASPGAGGYYISRDPRIMVFLDDVGHQIHIADQMDALDTAPRPMARVLYVPAGQPMWSRFSAYRRFRHLDLHLHETALRQHLTPALGASGAMTALRQPVELSQSPESDALAQLIVAEVATPNHHPLFAENLVWSLATGIMELTPAQTEPAALGTLSGGQMHRLRAFVQANLNRRISTREMASEVRLSESWFTHVFRQSTGETPQQWQLRLRIERAKELLTDRALGVSDVALDLGFSDQAHFTRVFRTVTGDTPAAWRKCGQFRPDASHPPKSANTLRA